MLEEIGINTMLIRTIKESPWVEVFHDEPYSLVFSFKYNGEIYFYKDKNCSKISPYNELVAEELAKDFGIPCVSYDLAALGKNRVGNISKNYKQDNVNYIEGTELLGLTHYYDSDLQNDLIDRIKPFRNILEDIWDGLEIRYHDYPDQRKIIDGLMKKIVDIYLFDILTCQVDRHDKNWQIIESSEFIDIAPLFDNERILNATEMFAEVSLGIDSVWENLWESIQKFQEVSSEEFTDIIKDKLWIISEENLYKVFERIEKKTEYPMPEERKQYYLNGYKKHREQLEEILNKENTRKR